MARAFWLRCHRLDPLLMYARRALSPLIKRDFEFRNSGPSLIKGGVGGITESAEPVKLSFDNLETTLPSFLGKQGVRFPELAVSI